MTNRHVQAPIFKVVIDADGWVKSTELFSPGLPEGDWILYCEPRNDLLQAAYMRGRTDEAALNAMQTIASEAALTHAYAEGRKDEREAHLPLSAKQVNLGWSSRNADGSNVGGGTTLEGWMHAVRWAERQHGVHGGAQ